MHCFISEKDAKAPTPIHILRPSALADFLTALPAPQARYAKARGFKANPGQFVFLPAADGSIDAILFGCGASDKLYANGARRAGTLSARLKPGMYEVKTKPDDWQWPEIAQFWGLGAYRFDRYLSAKDTPKLMLTPAMQPSESEAIVRAIWLGRDLINTPAEDMGPQALHNEAATLASEFGAQCTAVIGENLLSENYPMIHAVGRAGHQPPRLVCIEWGNKDAPSLSILGKGITFDTGGLNLKSGTGMRIMKKDMGGAAHALTLGRLIMEMGLNIHLKIWLAIAENAVAGNALRPGDVIASRKGLSVEIDNTDAEGRLVLGDALTRSAEDAPDLTIDFATLTGAARVALGPTLPPIFSSTQHLSALAAKSCDEASDPVWPMPLWQPYHDMLSSPIADMKNAGGSFAGAITAALFLQKFAGDGRWLHLDVYGWNPSSAPAHPKGGEIFAVRGLFNWLRNGGLSAAKN